MKAASAMQDLLAAHIECRPYSGEQDYQALRSMLTAFYARMGPSGTYTVGELDWWRFTEHDPNAISTVHFWEIDGQILAAAWPHPDSVDLFVDPNFRHLEDNILGWAEDWARAHAPHSEGVRFAATSFMRDNFRNALLMSRGYRRSERFFSCRARSLAMPIPKTKLPRGMSFQHVKGEQDLARRVAVHCDAMAPSTMTVDRYRRVVAAPTYCPDLDIVIADRSGDFVASCLTWFDPANKIGAILPVGVRQANQRQGLGKAVCYEAFRRLKALGAHRVQVTGWGGGWAREEAATHLFASVGLNEVGRDYLYLRFV